MKNKGMFIGIGLLVIIAFSIGFLAADIFLMDAPGEFELEEPDYDQLYNDCLDSQNVDCCRDSVEYMRENDYALLPDDGYGCPNGYGPGVLDCMGSLIWCEPLTEEEIENLDELEPV